MLDLNASFSFAFFSCSCKLITAFIIAFEKPYNCIHFELCPRKIKNLTNNFTLTCWEKMLMPSFHESKNCLKHANCLMKKGQLYNFLSGYSFREIRQQLIFNYSTACFENF